MGCIKVLVDEDFGLNSIKFNNPKIRKGARGIIINHDGKIAVFNKVNKNEYKLPGGGINDGETPEEAFKREALEETGCEIEIVKSLGTIEEHKSLENFKQISYIFVAKVLNDNHELNLTKKEKNEGSQILWLPKKEALDLITNCIENINESKYENLYHSKFIFLRDSFILRYYMNEIH